MITRRRVIIIRIQLLKIFLLRKCQLVSLSVSLVLLTQCHPKQGSSVKFQLGEASLPPVELAQTSQADARYPVVVVEDVEDVVHARKLGTPEDWGTAEGESPQLGAGRQFLFFDTSAGGILLLMLQRHRQQLSNSCSEVDDDNKKSNDCLLRGSSQRRAGRTLG